MDGCLTWLSKGFEDLGFVLYLAGKASKGVRLSAHSAGDSLGLALFNDRVTNELMSPPGPPPPLLVGPVLHSHLPRCRWWPWEAGAPSLTHPQPHLL